MAEFAGNVPAGPATVRVQTQVQNSQNSRAPVTVACEILNPRGESVARFSRSNTMEALGDNGIRTSYNPPTPELLEACDGLGMLVRYKELHRRPSQCTTPPAQTPSAALAPAELFHAVKIDPVAKADGNHRHQIS
jgi:hypothetical protein